MKREVMFVLVFSLFLVSIIFVYADEAGQVEEGYSYLESRVNQVGCSGLSFNERLFINLAIEKCTSELTADGSSNQCWPRTGCTIKSTAQTVLALNDEIDTSPAEKWLLDTKKISTGSELDWFLEIEITDGTRSTCDISYPGSTSKVVVNADKTISSSAGRYLTLTQGNYWLKVAPAIYGQDITIKCDKDFLTTLLFMKTGGSTVHVLKDAQSSSAGGETTEKVKSLCFGQNNRCDYEGSLWATFVLYLVGDYQEELEYVMPYLVAKKSDYKIYLPQAFLYYLTGGDYVTELLTMQKASGYWSESGNRYYDTAVAMLPFSSDYYFEGRSDAIDWLLENQQSNGAWNNNLADTAFMLYSIWPKETSVKGRCQDDSQCAQVSCKDVSCVSGQCLYEDVGCYNYDGCCSTSKGCTSENDNDCEDINDIECEDDNDCPDDSTGDRYCYGDGVYEDFFDVYCDTSVGECDRDTLSEIVEECTGSQVCDQSTATCKSEGREDECNYFKGCGDGYKCDYSSNTCVPDIVCEYDYECGETSYSTDYCLDDKTIYRDVNTYFCDLSTISGECYANEETEFVAECTALEECKDGVCIMIGGDECGDGWLDKKCEDGYECENGYCVPELKCYYDEDCPYQECYEATCDGGVCFYDYICASVECDEDIDCEEWNLEPIKYCNGPDSDDVYIEYYNYTCENKVCVENISNVLFEDCNGGGCYVDECYGPEPECYDDWECEDLYGYGYECEEGVCIEKEICDDDSDCDYGYEHCVGGICVPYDCLLDSDCTFMENGKCTEDGCIYERISCDGYGYCYPEAICSENYGVVMEEYFCNSEIQKCCDKEIPIKTCAEEGGELCYDGKTCSGGYIAYTSDTLDDQICCVGGVCQDISTADTCAEEGGICKTSCDSDEQQKGYSCDYDDEVCCVEGGEPDKPKRGWILIVILLILIILAVVGIVFRDKLRTEWIKIRDKFSGKKEKKKFEMPSTHAIPPGRLLPRRILPPGAHPPTTQSRFPLRPGQTPPTLPPSRQPTSSLQSTIQKLSHPASISPASGTKPSQSTPSPSTASKPSQPAKIITEEKKPVTTTTKTETPTKSKTEEKKTPVKKSEEKHKSNELNDVLKKLKDMSGNK